LNPKGRGALKKHRGWFLATRFKASQEAAGRQMRPKGAVAKSLPCGAGRSPPEGTFLRV